VMFPTPLLAEMQIPSLRESFRLPAFIQAPVPEICFI
jgi:hypothetical protein